MRQIPANAYVFMSMLLGMAIFAFGYWLGAHDTLNEMEKLWKKRDEQEAEFIRETRNEFLRRPHA